MLQDSLTTFKHISDEEWEKLEEWTASEVAARMVEEADNHRRVRLGVVCRTTRDQAKFAQRVHNILLAMAKPSCVFHLDGERTGIIPPPRRHGDAPQLTVYLGNTWKRGLKGMKRIMLGRAKV